MIVTLQTERVRTLEQVRAFVECSEPVDFAGAGREGIYALVRRTLVRLDYHRLGKPDKGLVRRYLAKVTGLSRAQLTRLIGRHRRTGRIENRRGGPPAKPFERRYTRLDIRLLARLDTELGQMSGPATRAVLRRQWEVFGDARFERLSGLSNGHLYNLRKSRTYRNVRRVVERTRPPYEKFKSLPGAERYLVEGLSFETLDAQAHAVSDFQAAEALNRARRELFRRIGQEGSVAA